MRIFEIIREIQEIEKSEGFSKKQLREMIAEHKRLVKVLENDKSKENQKEYKRQKKELQDYIEQYSKMKSEESDIEKAWQSAQIGEVRTRKDGKKYRKVASTGSEKDWQLVTDPKSKKQDNTGSKRGKQNANDNSKQPKENLSDQAKNVSETALQSAIKQSPDPEVRTAAHEELDRREKEEKPQEESEDSKTETKDKSKGKSEK